MPSVSIVMTVYNHESFVQESIRSCLDQTYKDIELVIVDDGSTDKSWELVLGFKDPRIICFQQENAGPALAFNRAVEKASGEYIAFMSGDDVCELDRVEKQLKYLKNASAHSVIFSRVKAIDEQSKPMPAVQAFEPPNAPATLSRELALQKLFWDGNYLCAPSAFMSKKTWQDIGGFFAVYFQLQDYELWIRMAQSHDFVITDEALLKYRVHRKSLSFTSKHTHSATMVELMLVITDFLENADDSTISVLSGVPASKERLVHLEQICSRYRFSEVRAAIAMMAYKLHKNDNTIKLEKKRILREIARDAIKPTPNLLSRVFNKLRR